MEFTELDRRQGTHLFVAFKHHSDDARSWRECVKLCLEAWKIQAEAYRKVGQTGFATTELDKLNERGRDRLPATPVEDENITRNVYITDITEVMALRLLQHWSPDVRFPRPRVLHKELRYLQHHGIDLLGYEETPDGYVLVIVEVMASIERRHPPGTVRDHYGQLLDDTLGEDPPDRLLDDLAFVHDESTDAHDKEILNGFISAVTDGKLGDIEGQRAVGVLVRPDGLWGERDWQPFLQNTDAFEAAKIPATVWFGVIESDSPTFSELMNRVKCTATTPPPSPEA